MWQLFIGKAYAYTIGVPIKNGQTQYASFSAYLLDLIGQAVYIAGGLALLMILYGSFKYVTAGGDDSKIKDAKDIITSALIGFALLVLIKVILPLIQVQ